MEQALFEHLKVDVASAPAGQGLANEVDIQCVDPRQVAAIALARRTKKTCEARVCPHCRSNDIVLHGKDQNERQRFKCRGCRKTYNILTGTPMARARKPEKWGHYLGCMTEHMPLRSIVASGIGVHLVTAWRWRHRFLTAAANDNAAVLSDVVEADTIVFQRSFKGSRDRNTQNRRERRAAGLRRTSHEPVPVLTALDTGGSIFQAILSSVVEIERALEGRICAGSILCSDGKAAYVNAARTAGAAHRAVFFSTAAPPAGGIAPDADPARLGLWRVNNHHQRLRYLVDERCCGVATKYLVNYLGWHRSMVRAGFQGRMLLDRALG